MCVCMCMCVRVYVPVYEHMRVNVYVYIYIYIYIYIYTRAHTHAHTQTNAPHTSLTTRKRANCLERVVKRRPLGHSPPQLNTLRTVVVERISFLRSMSAVCPPIGTITVIMRCGRADSKALWNTAQEHWESLR